MNQEQLMNLILDHYENPRNYGEIQGADIVQDGGNPGCGDIIRVYLNISEDGTVTDAHFSGEGCMISQAGTSLLLERLKGKTVKEIEEMTYDVVRETLGNRIITTRPECARVGYNTLKNAVKEWKKVKALSSN